MNRENAKRWEKEIAFWGNGGNLWFLSHNNKWSKYIIVTPMFDTKDQTAFVMEDQHFEARKAFALGEPIEWADKATDWTITESPTWERILYRPKPKPKPEEWYDNIPEKGILCWVWDEFEEYKIANIVINTVNNEHGLFYKTDSLMGNSWRNAEPIKPKECYRK